MHAGRQRCGGCLLCGACEQGQPRHRPAANVPDEERTSGCTATTVLVRKDLVRRAGALQTWGGSSSRQHGSMTKVLDIGWACRVSLLACPNRFPVSTLLCVTAQQVVVANVGDSRAVLSRGGRALDLSAEHRVWGKTPGGRAPPALLPCLPASEALAASCAPLAVGAASPPVLLCPLLHPSTPRCPTLQQASWLRSSASSQWGDGWTTAACAACWQSAGAGKGCRGQSTGHGAAQLLPAAPVLPLSPACLRAGPTTQPTCPAAHPPACLPACPPAARLPAGPLATWSSRGRRG